MATIRETFDNNNLIPTENQDFSLARVDDKTLIGVDKDGNTVLVIQSDETKVDSISQRTKELSFECNKNITYVENDVIKGQISHVIRCFSKEMKDRNIFLKLCDTFFLDKKNKIEDIVNFFSVMTDFFGAKQGYSQQYLQGLYGELYTIYKFSGVIDFGRYWQNQDRLKFDFSINESTKLEIKSTCKQQRIHHFKHEQLATNIVDIYVLSYKFRRDNDGLSLLDLINKCIPLLSSYPQKQARLLKVIYDLENDDTLEQLRFLESYTVENMKFIDAKDIPRFQETTPENISDAEYDSNCEGVNFQDENQIISYFKSLEMES